MPRTVHSEEPIGVTCKLLLFSVIFTNILPIHGEDIRATGGRGWQRQTQGFGRSRVALRAPIEGVPGGAGLASARNSSQQAAGIRPRSTSDKSVKRSLRETRWPERVAAASDPCDADPRRSFPASVLVKCIDRVKFAYARDVGNFNSVIKTLATFYPFRHLAKASPNPRLPGKYDVVAALLKLRQGWARYRGQPARRFHKKFYSLVAALNDARTTYRSSCFIHGVYLLSLSLVSHQENGAFVITVAPEHSDRAACCPGAPAGQIDGLGAWSSNTRDPPPLWK